MSTLAPPPPSSAVSPPAAAAKPRGVKQDTQGFFTIWHGMNYGTWSRLCRMGVPRSSKYWLKQASITALSLSNSWHEACESALFGRRVAATKIEHPPVFVLGHWRSGTTLLHNWLTLDPQFTFPNLYQTLFPGHFLLTERVVSTLASSLLPHTRPMDNVKTGWQLPQEDEVALLLRTLVSPYLMLGFQGQPERYDRFFDLTRLSSEELALWVREFMTFLRKITYRTQKPIVLKSPSHTFRIPLLLDLFPQAKFVYIYRDPYAVFSSGVHLRRTLFGENALAEPNLHDVENETLRFYMECFERYESTKSLVPAGQLHELRFEDLEADPIGEMRLLYQRIGLSGWDNFEPLLQAQLPAHSTYRKNRFSLDPATTRMVYERCRPVFDRYGYPSRLSDQAEERAA